MRKIGLVITVLGIAGFCFFKFIIVKIAYAKCPAGKYFDGFWDILIYAYHQPPPEPGWSGGSDLSGPVSYFENDIYIFCAIWILAGLCLMLFKTPKAAPAAKQ